MTVPSPRDSQVVQNLIIADLRRRLKKIVAGAPVGVGVYGSTLRAIYETPEALTSIDDWQLPAAMVFLDGATSLTVDSGVHRYTGSWDIEIGLVARDSQETDDGEQAAVPRILHVLLYDVLRALHLEGDVDPCSGTWMDTGWTARAWKIDGYDTRIGMGTLSVTVLYNMLIQ